MIIITRTSKGQFSSKWTDNKKAWLMKNYNKTYREMSEHLGISEETIRVTINGLGLKRTSRYRPFKIDSNDLEFQADLDNPRLSAPDIVEKYINKYGIGVSRIHQLRKQRGIKLQINTLARESSAEREVRELLDEMDLAYIQEKRIGKYSLDFYLGFHICIEVHGEYWHKQPRRVKSDKRKADYLSSNGYNVIYIWESDLPKARDIILSSLKNLGLPV